jgi:hypothetical protein
MNTTVSTGTRGPAVGRQQSRPRRAVRPERPAARPADRVRRPLPADRVRRPLPAAGTRPAAGATTAAARRTASRTPFILLVVALLSGGLVCLLVINTTLAAASFRISNLQRENAASAQRVQELQQQVSTDRSANAIEQRARRLGLREQQTINVIDLQTGRRYTMPARVRGVSAVPGYTP